LTVSSVENLRRTPVVASCRSVWSLVRPWVRARTGRFIIVLALVLVGRTASLALPASTKYLVDDVIIGRHLWLLWPIILGIIAAGIVQAMSQFGLSQMLARDGHGLVQHLRCRLQAHVIRLPVSFFDSRQSGTLGRQIIEEPVSARNLFGVPFVEFVGSILIGLGSLVFLLRISVYLTGAALLTTIVVTVLSRSGFKRKRPLLLHYLNVSGDVTGRLVESIAGVRVVKGYRAEMHEQKSFAAAADRLRVASMDVALAGSGVAAASTTALAAGMAAIMYLATNEIVAGRLTLGSMVTFMTFLVFLRGPMAQLAPVGTLLAEAAASLGQVDRLLRHTTEHANPRRHRVLDRIDGDIVFDNVSFSYDDGAHTLKNISFTAKPGTVTALVGPSGAGKSTIISLVAAYYEATAGQVRVDGVDLCSITLDSYRRQLGVVLQDNFLFDGTIRENVALARPDAADHEVLDACRIAHVDQFVARMPQGYDTVVGERGVRLSMGQRQRVSIARAALANPRILLLDEATSSLDSESEAAIQMGLDYLLKGRTTFVVAHRLSTIQRADQILVIEDGRVVERGTHDSLLARQGRYYDLSMRPFSDSDLMAPHYWQHE
jgi:ABC-type multidrug transport system fused ATPase/permease subunit